MAATTQKKKLARKKANIEQVRFTHPEFDGAFCFPTFARVPSLLMDEFIGFYEKNEGREEDEISDEEGTAIFHLTNKLIRFCAKHTTDEDTREVLEEISSEEFMTDLMPKWQEASQVDASKSVPVSKAKKDA